MSFHIPGPTRGKVEHLMTTYGAMRLQRAPMAFDDLPEDRALICVIDTIMYETAILCFSGVEFLIHDDPTDFRRRVWLLMDKDKAHELSHFPQDTTRHRG